MSNVKKAEGKLGVLVVGLGAVSTTFMTGVLMTRKGLAKPDVALVAGLNPTSHDTS